MEKKNPREIEWRVNRATKKISDLWDEPMICEALNCSKDSFREYRDNLKYECPDPIARPERQRALYLAHEIVPWIEKMKKHRYMKALVKHKKVKKMYGGR